MFYIFIDDMSHDIRLLEEEEMKQYTECIEYTQTPSGNLINSGTRWKIEGYLISKIEVEEKEISCSNRSD